MTSQYFINGNGYLYLAFHIDAGYMENGQDMYLSQDFLKSAQQQGVEFECRLSGYSLRDYSVLETKSSNSFRGYFSETTIKGQKAGIIRFDINEDILDNPSFFIDDYIQVIMGYKYNQDNRQIVFQLSKTDENSIDTNDGISLDIFEKDGYDTIIFDGNNERIQPPRVGEKKKDFLTFGFKLIDRKDIEEGEDPKVYNSLNEEECKQLKNISSYKWEYSFGANYDLDNLEKNAIYIPDEQKLTDGGFKVKVNNLWQSAWTGQKLTLTLTIEVPNRCVVTKSKVITLATRGDAGQNGTGQATAAYVSGEEDLLDKIYVEIDKNCNRKYYKTYDKDKQMLSKNIINFSYVNTNEDVEAKNIQMLVTTGEQNDFIPLFEGEKKDFVDPFNLNEMQIKELSSSADIGGLLFYEMESEENKKRNQNVLPFVIILGKKDKIDFRISAPYSKIGYNSLGEFNCTDGSGVFDVDIYHDNVQIDDNDAEWTVRGKYSEQIKIDKRKGKVDLGSFGGGVDLTFPKQISFEDKVIKGFPHILKYSSKYGTVFFPLWLYTGGGISTAVDSWDGENVDIGQAYIITPQLVAGEKDNNNRFTGVVAGKYALKDSSSTTGIGNTQTGLMTFCQDFQTAFLNAKDGSVRLGVGNNGINIVPDINGKLSSYISGGGYGTGSGMKIDLGPSQCGIYYGNENFSVNDTGYLIARGGCLIETSSNTEEGGESSFSVNQDGFQISYKKGNSSSLINNDIINYVYKNDNGDILAGINYDGKGNLTITGKITATTGNIGGWEINRKCISSPTGKLILYSDGTISGVASGGDNYVDYDELGLNFKGYLNLSGARNTSTLTGLSSPPATTSTGSVRNISGSTLVQGESSAILSGKECSTIGSKDSGIGVVDNKIFVTQASSKAYSFEYIKKNDNSGYVKHFTVFYGSSKKKEEEEEKNIYKVYQADHYERKIQQPAPGETSYSKNVFVKGTGESLTQYIIFKFDKSKAEQSKLEIEDLTPIYVDKNAAIEWRTSKDNDVVNDGLITEFFKTKYIIDGSRIGEKDEKGNIISPRQKANYYVYKQENIKLSELSIVYIDGLPPHKVSYKDGVITETYIDYNEKKDEKGKKIYDCSIVLPKTLEYTLTFENDEVKSLEYPDKYIIDLSDYRI